MQNVVVIYIYILFVIKMFEMLERWVCTATELNYIKNWKTNLNQS